VSERRRLLVRRAGAVVFLALEVVFSFNLKDNLRPKIELARLFGWRNQLGDIEFWAFILLNVILVVGCATAAVLLWRRPRSASDGTPSRFP
jgi:hypothetical protein